jgi:hypothetical protein
MQTISVRLEDYEVTALVNLAQNEHRHPRDQAGFLLRLKLKELGLIVTSDTATMVKTLPVVALAMQKGEQYANPA